LDELTKQLKSEEERRSLERQKLQKEQEEEIERIKKQGLLEKEKLEKLALENAKLKKQQMEAAQKAVEEAKRIAELKAKELDEFKKNIESEKMKKEAAERKKIEQRHEELECQICTDWCIKAHNIRCGHTFCKKCLFEWIGSFKKDKAKDKHPTCPSCRNEITGDPVPNLILDKLISRWFIDEADEETREAWNERATEHKEWEQKFEKQKKTAVKKPVSTSRPRSRNTITSLFHALNQHDVYSGASASPASSPYQSEENKSDDSGSNEPQNLGALDLRKQCKGWTGSRRCPITAQHGFDGTTSNQRQWALPLVHGEDYCRLHKPG